MVDSSMKFIFSGIAFKTDRKMETLGLPEVNLSKSKSERKKTSLPSSRSKFRQLRRSHAAADDVDNSHSASALIVSMAVGLYGNLYSPY